MAPQFLYFDLGNVLLTFSNEKACQQLAQLAGASPEAIESLLLGEGEGQSFLWRFERGEMTGEAFYQAFCRAIGTTLQRDAFSQALCDMFAPIDPSFALIQQLAASGHRMGILSNTNVLHWQFVTDGRFALLSGIAKAGGAFELAVTSFDAGSMKPAFPIYEIAIDRANVPASEIFFVDDRPENVAGAKAAGIDAVQYRDPLTLLHDLVVRGLTF